MANNYKIISLSKTDHLREDLFLKEISSGKEVQYIDFCADFDDDILSKLYENFDDLSISFDEFEYNIKQAIVDYLDDPDSESLKEPVSTSEISKLYTALKNSNNHELIQVSEMFEDEDFMDKKIYFNLKNSNKNKMPSIQRKPISIKGEFSYKGQLYEKFQKLIFRAIEETNPLSTLELNDNMTWKIKYHIYFPEKETRVIVEERCSRPEHRSFLNKGMYNIKVNKFRVFKIMKNGAQTVYDIKRNDQAFNYLKQALYKFSRNIPIEKRLNYVDVFVSEDDMDSDSTFVKALGVEVFDRAMYKVKYFPIHACIVDMLKSLATSIQYPLSILALGSGTGQLPHRILKTFSNKDVTISRMSCLEIDKKATELCKQKLNEFQNTKKSFFVKNVKDLNPSEVKGHNVIILSGILNHSFHIYKKDEEQILSTIYKEMDNNGFVFISGAENPGMTTMDFERIGFTVKYIQLKNDMYYYILNKEAYQK